MATQAEIDKLYQQELGRKADVSGSKTYAGKSVDEIRKALRGSAEFKSKGGSTLVSSGKKSYGDRYTRESFINEFRQLNRGANPDEGTIRNWVKYGKGVGQYSAETSYDRNYVKQVMIDANNRLTLDPTKAKAIYKVHTDADAFKQMYGSVSGLGGTKGGVFHILPMSLTKGFKGSQSVAPVGKSVAETSAGFSQFLQQQFGIDPSQFGLTRTSTAPSKKWFQRVTEDALSLAPMMLFGPAGMAVWSVDKIRGTKNAENLRDTVFDKWVPNEVKFIADPLNIYGNILDKDWSREASQSGAKLLGTEVEKLQKYQQAANIVVDTALTFTGMAPVVAAKNTLQAINQFQASGGSTEAFKQLGINTAVGAAKAAVANYAPGITSKVVANATIDTAGNMARGLNFGKSLTETVWGVAGRATGGAANVLRLQADEEYKRRIEESPLGWFQFAANTASDAGSFYQTYQQSGSATAALAAPFGLYKGTQQGKPVFGTDFRMTPAPYKVEVNGQTQSLTGMSAFRSRMNEDFMRTANDMRNALTVYSPIVGATASLAPSQVSASLGYQSLGAEQKKGEAIKIDRFRSDQINRLTPATVPSYLLREQPKQRQQDSYGVRTYSPFGS